MSFADYVKLVRAPAALTVLGDTVAGAAAAGNPLRGKRFLLPVASVAFYWSGMALNDWADRDVDAEERPERPIPSGRISPNAALGTAIGLTAAGLGLAALAGGARALPVAAALAGAVWSYDTVLKDTMVGPVAMASCRALDVTLGAGNGKAALPAAMAVGAHTLGLTVLSRGEVYGTRPWVATIAMASSMTAALGAGVGRSRSGWHRLVGAGAAAGFVRLVGRKQWAAVRKPDAATVRSATVAGIHGMIPLQAAITARGGSARAGALVALALPLARRLGRKVSPT